ncbi:uncharacterized protein LOC113294866 [Papaver somniferum]|uniref:uncharacterized protein LOC113294866 n=1 Tax=Papaver somniferum TaxID=3469 RepID=UPI000E6FA21B|nr:uncharacterized protein LOC113294866 [Papaver somniferum]
MWAHTRNGQFIIKSAYRIFVNDNVSSEVSVFWKKVWGINCLPKIKFFMWKIFDNMLHVNSLLHLYNPDVNSYCPLCSNHEETVMHLFVNYPIAAHIWFGLSIQRLILSDSDWIDDLFLYWHNPDLPESPYNVSWPSVAAIVFWCIWKLRCDVLFRQISIDLSRVILDIKRMINSYIDPLKNNHASVSFMVSKSPSAEVDHFMFVDGSFKYFNMGLGVIWCDYAGNVRSSRDDFGLVLDAVGAEAAALILAISWAEELNLSKVVFVSDCLQLVQFVNGVSRIIDWRSGDLLEQCRSLLSKFTSFKSVYVKRLNNPFADRLARRARKDSLKDIWVSFPSFLNSLFGKKNLNVVCNSLIC